MERRHPTLSVEREQRDYPAVMGLAGVAHVSILKAPHFEPRDDTERAVAGQRCGLR